MDKFIGHSIEAAVPHKTTRIKKLQIVFLTLIFLGGIINFLDRGSLSVANEAIRSDLGLSATQFGLLLSAFSLSYGIFQLPSGLLLDKIGPRVILGGGLLIWSVMQAMAGVVNNFSHFIMLRIGLGVGEAPFMPCGVKVINDWFSAKERGIPVGIFNSSTTIGQAFAPPILVALMLAFGWRTMFVIIGVAGIVISVCWLVWYKNRATYPLTQSEEEYLDGDDKTDSHEKAKGLAFKEWLGLFKYRSVWGMILGFSGVNYTAWLYLSWLPGYLQSARGLSLSSTGMIAGIPFLCGSIGMLVNGFLSDKLAQKGYSLIKTRKSFICLGLVISAFFTLLVVQAQTTALAVTFISLALFFIHFAGTSAWGLVQVMTPSKMVASVSSIQNFGSFIFASIAPVLTGWVVDTTHSFNLALVICSCVTFAGALCYFFVVKNPISEPQA